MADVNSSSSDERDRGQLILVGGLVVAFALVALVLLLNTTLFAQNLSTRGIDPAADRAGDHLAFAEHAGGTVLATENAPEAGYEDWTDVNEAVVRDLRSASNTTRNGTFRRTGAHAAFSVLNTREGEVVIQNETRGFTAQGGIEDWVLANTTGIRAFTMTVDPDGSATDPFAVNVTSQDGSGGSWGATVTETGAGEVRVSTSNGDTCTTSGPSATINWTVGTLGDCSFGFGVNETNDLTGTLDLAFENGDAATGTYRVVVSTEESDQSVTDIVASGPSATEPWAYPAVYSVLLETTYREGETNLGLAVRVAPDEPPQTSPSP